MDRRYSRLSEIARDGTKNDARKIGRMFFPLHRKAMTWSSSLVRVEGRGPARVPAVADLQGVMSGFEWHLERAVQFDRPGTRAVDHDVVRAAADLHADRFVRINYGTPGLAQDVITAFRAAPVRPHSREQVAGYFAGLEMIEPTRPGLTAASPRSNGVRGLGWFRRRD